MDEVTKQETIRLVQRIVWWASLFAPPILVILVSLLQLRLILIALAGAGVVLGLVIGFVLLRLPKLLHVIQDFLIRIEKRDWWFVLFWAAIVFASGSLAFLFPLEIYETYLLPLFTAWGLLLVQATKRKIKTGSYLPS